MNEQFVGKDPNRINVGKEIFKALKENCKEKIGYIPLKPMALVEVTEPDSSILKGIGFSEPNDLLLDNFGAFLGAAINNGVDAFRNLTDRNGNVQDVHVQENQNLRMFNATEITPVALSLGGFLAIGKGDVTSWDPQRSDFDLRTPFVTPPESNNIAVAIPAWISEDQEGIVTGLVTNTQLAGVVGECGMFCIWRIGFGTGASSFMISHDKTGVPFGAGANIQITYTWSLS